MFCKKLYKNVQKKWKYVRKMFDYLIDKKNMLQTKCYKQNVKLIEILF